MHTVKCAAEMTGLYGSVLFRTSMVALTLALASFPAIPTNASSSRTATSRIEGTVRLTTGTRTPVASGVYPSRRVSRPLPRASEIANVVVFLKDAPQRPGMTPGHATILQKDESFEPRVLAVTRGSTVDFPNADPFFHNVFSLSRHANFDLGRYPRNESRSRRFDTPGLVKVFCHIHSHMTASIMVFDHPFFRIPQADGTFRLEDVPAGTHQVSAWHERIGESVSTIRIEPGAVARVEFSLPMEDR